MQEFREVAKLYPSIKAEEMIVDNTCMQLTGEYGHQLQVQNVKADLSAIVADNLFADLQDVLISLMSW